MSSSSLSSPSLPPRPPLLPTVSSAAGLNPNCPADDDDDDGAISSDSSSIGSPSDDEEDVQEEETESKSSAKDSQSSSLSSLGSLEDSLPIKRGLSTHFAGKSRSFVNLAACAAAGDVANLAKQENPFNKRRRIQIASKISYKRRASCSALVAAAMPSSVRSAERAVREVAEGEEDEGDDEEPRGFPSLSPPPRAHGARFRPVVLRSPRSVPLFDL